MGLKMTEDDLRMMAGMLSDIFHDLHDNELISEELSEKLLEFWRYFSSFN